MLSDFSDQILPIQDFMRVAYITSYNSEDVKNWSGTGYYIAEALKTQGIDLIRINCKADFTFLQRLKRKINKVFFKQLLQLDREPAYLKSLAKNASKQLREKEYDIVLSPGSLPIAYLKTNKPLVFVTDATYDCLMKLYLKDQALSKHTIENGNKAEEIAIEKASMVFYTSDWAIESAINKYNADKKKLKKLNFGANLTKDLNELQIKALIASRKQQKVIKLLFIGVDWYRKGAKKAIDTATMLINTGFQVSLTLVGCKIPNNETLPNFVTYYPFIAKDSNEGRLLLDTLFQEASFFILPTEADCTPIVFSEAASYGLPVITTNTGGCTSVVLDKETGYCLDPENFIEEAATIIGDLMNDLNRYEKMSLNSFFRYSQYLNWNVFGKDMVKSLESLLIKS